MIERKDIEELRVNALKDQEALLAQANQRAGIVAACDILLQKLDEPSK